MDRKIISEALGSIDEIYIVEALSKNSSGKAYTPGKENREINNSSVNKGVRVLLIAVVMAMVLALGAGAVVVFNRYENSGEMMENFAGGSDYMSGSAKGYEKYEITERPDGEERILLSELYLGWERLSTNEAILEELVYPYVADVDGSITFEDYTITMEACIYDKDLLAGILYYTVENPNGISWESREGDVIFLESDIHIGTSFYGASFVDEERSTDTKLYICEHFIVATLWMDESPPEGLHIKNNEYCLDFEPYLAQWEKIEVPHTELEDGNIVIAPFGMTFSQNGIGANPGTNHQYIALRFADGSEYVVYDRLNLFANELRGNSNGPMSNHWETHLFNSIIDINAVVEVQIDDTVFNLE